MSFWIIAAALAIGTGLLLALAALRGRAGAEPPASYDLRVYRDQLREIERDASRGVVAADEAARLRAEVSRRILAADAQLRADGPNAGQPRIAGRAAAFVAMVLVAGGGLALYAALGAPGYGDMPLAARVAASEAARAERLGQDAAEARFGPGETAPPEGTSQEQLDLVEQLRKVVAARPNDQKGLRFLVRSEAALGRMAAAREAQEKLVALRGDAASATDHAMLAELMIEAAGGYVSTDAAAALHAALERDPRAPTARFYLGLWHLQLGRPDLAFPVWRDLLEDSTPDAPWVPAIRAEIGAIAQRAGVRYTPPAETEGRGPSAADMEAAGDMTPEARAEMIRSMVAGLSRRLATDGGPPEDWARLINAYGVMGETAQARRIWTEARETFGGDARALGILRTAAEAAGVTE
ncbi:MAG: c-type cytochrome biogenesis protein CcmI [Roseovarius sp.]